MSVCQCQWVLCEADIQMKLGAQEVYLGVTHVRDKSKIGQESLSLQGTPDRGPVNPVTSPRAKLAHEKNLVLGRNGQFPCTLSVFSYRWGPSWRKHGLKMKCKRKRKQSRIKKILSFTRNNKNMKY